MGFIVHDDENAAGIDFEIRRESVIFFFKPGDADGECFEVSKQWLGRLRHLLNDDQWRNQIIQEHPHDND